MVFHDSKVLVGGGFPVITYVHSSGFDEVFGGSLSKAWAYTWNHSNVVRETLSKGMLCLIKDPSYAVSVLWGNTNSRKAVLDTFVFGNLTNWKDNPEFAAGVFSDGKLVNGPTQAIGCGDALMMLGIEEERRRITADREYYLSLNPRNEVKARLVNLGLWRGMQ